MLGRIGIVDGTNTGVYRLGVLVEVKFSIVINKLRGSGTHLSEAGSGAATMTSICDDCGDCRGGLETRSKREFALLTQHVSKKGGLKPIGPHLN